jgi:hypothetical protein
MKEKEKKNGRRVSGKEKRLQAVSLQSTGKRIKDFAEV